MKISCIAILMMGIMLSGPATAKIYRYVDDNGQVNFTDDLSIVPERKRAKVTEQEEIPSTYRPPAITRSTGSVTVTPSPQSNEKLQKKQQLEAEYQELLKEKEALDNNKSFQKRRKKRKYKHRPHIKELVEKEQQVIQRLAILEQELKAFE